MIDKYKAWLISNGSAKNTVISYCNLMTKVLQVIDLDNLTEENIVKYILELNEKYKDTTVNQTKKALRSFCRFLNLDIRIPKDKTVDIRLPKFITEEYFEKEIINIVPHLFNSPLKINAMLYFLFYSGLRKGEFINLKRNDINLTKSTIKVYRQKTKTERLTILAGKKAKSFVELYFGTEAEGDNAFNISEASLKYIFEKIDSYLKNQEFYAHLLRHSFATHLRKKGVSIEDIQYLLGHKNISTTMIYAHVEIDGLKNRIDKIIK